ncbi:MAG: hypothetical protein V4676_11960 [Bacteroidota bacterium]
MIEEYQQEQRKKTTRLRSVMDFTMGILLIIMGSCFLLYNQLKLTTIFNRPHSALDYVIGGLFIVYGAWRIYRGYKKDYFTQ